MSSESVCLSLTAGFTALLGVCCVGPLIMPVTVELMALLVLLCVAHAMTRVMNPIDRTARVAALVVAGMLGVTELLLWQRGEPVALFTGLLRTVGRFGLVAFLASWTAVFSAQRSDGQYVYNLVFVSSFGLLIGHVSTRLMLDLPAVGAPGSLAAWLEGAALGAAFAYVSLALRETPKLEASSGGTAP